MRPLRRLLHGLLALIRRHRIEHDLDDELRQYLEAAVADRMRGGLSPDAARRAVQAELGSVAALKDNVRDVGWESWLESLWQDARFAARSFRRTPGPAILVVLMLTMAVGANTAIFSIVNVLLFRPLPFLDADRLVVVPQVDRNGDLSTVSPADFQDWRERVRTLDAMAAYVATRQTLAGVRYPEPVVGLSTSSAAFSLFGAALTHGRVFSTADENAGQRVAVISDALWRRQFDAAPDAIGRVIQLDGIPSTIVGVLAPGVRLPLAAEADVFVPLTMAADRRDRGEHSLMVVGRLRQDATVAQATADLDRVSRDLATRFPATNTSVTARAMPLADWIAGARGPRVMWILLAAAGLLLLMACANIANLLLLRANCRAHELATRMALGASRRRIVRQVFTEALSLGVAGGAAGVVLALAGRDLFVGLMPADLRAVVPTVPLDGRVLTYALAVTVLTTIVAAIAPALSVTSTIATTAPPLRVVRRPRGHAALLAAEAGLAVIVVVAAVLVGRSWVALWSTPLGFDPTDVTIARVTLPTDRYGEPVRVRRFYEEVVSHLTQRPGVTAAAAVTNHPFGGLTSRSNITLTAMGPPDDGPIGNGAQGLLAADRVTVTPDYFRAMNVSLVDGRYFDAGDGAGAPLAVIVNEAFVREFWPGPSAVGRQFRRGIPRAVHLPWMTVVGVVGDVKHDSLEMAARPTFYLPLSQNPEPAMTLVVRGAASDAAAVLVRDAVRSVDAEQPVARAETLADVVSAAAAARRAPTVWLILFAALAGLLASGGVYGIVANAVASRRREFGILMALGGCPRDIQMSAMRRGMRPVVAGTVVGLAVAAVLAPQLGALLFQIGPRDPLSLVLAGVLPIGAGLLASFVPARRAATIDPAMILRSE